MKSGRGETRKEKRPSISTGIKKKEGTTTRRHFYKMIEGWIEKKSYVVERTEEKKGSLVRQGEKE